MTTLIIARHGNTFGAGDTPTRVGKHTDLPLTDKGLKQGHAIGAYLRDNRLIPDMVYASNLQRTQQTAQAAIKESGVSNPVYTLDMFDEIDYGPDENKPESDVIARIGADAIADWDARAQVPDGWIIDPAEVIENWISFGEHISKPMSSHDLIMGSGAADLDSSGPQENNIRGNDETVLVVTSNGIARFAPYLTGDFDGFAATHSIKLSTGAFGILKHDASGWRVESWNFKP